MVKIARLIALSLLSAISAAAQYTIIVPAPGRIALYAYKPSANIPDTRVLIFQSGKEDDKEITVADGSTVDDVDLRLPAPYGSVSIVVLDSTTHQPIHKGAGLTLRLVENPSIYLIHGNVNGVFHYALPDRPITLSVAAPAMRRGLMWTQERATTI